MRLEHCFKRNALFLALAFWVVGATAQEVAPQQSTTGPTPPPSVLAQKAEVPGGAITSISGVPGYAWRHGCGPTALGMVIGYFDSHGFDDLYPGDAGTQTEQVNQAMASQGSGTRGSGLQKHYENYALPNDSNSPTILLDSSETYPSGCHANDSIADYMHTSWSHDGNFYGWSFSNRIVPAFTSYVALKNPNYVCAGTEYTIQEGTLTWQVLTQQIDSNRPMVLLVDSDGNGGTDHFVTLVGYTDTPSRQYGCLDTWSPYDQVKWHAFAPIASGTTWGIWGGWSFRLQYSLKTSASNGAIAKLPAQTGYDPGATVRLTAHPNTGFRFLSWAGDVPADQRTVNPLDLVMDANKDVTASFGVGSYTLTYTAGANGTIQGASPQTVNHGGSGTPVTAVPNTDYRFVKWSDDSTQNPRQDVNVTRDITVTASFASGQELLVETPQFSPAPGTYASAQDVAITCATPGATIRYTTNGGEPSESSTAYTGPVRIAATTTLKARAWKSGYTPSGTQSGLYTISTGTTPVDMPQFTPPPGTYNSAQDVAISCATAGATIRYTTNGGEPSESSTAYTGPVHIAATMTLKAKAWKLGSTPSGMQSGLYTISSQGEHTLRVVDTTIGSGENGVVPIQLQARGDENAMTFSIQWDPTKLTYVSASRGLNISMQETFLPFTLQTDKGRLGFMIALAPGTAAPVGTREVAQVTFRAATVSGSVSAPVAFVDQPTARSISDPGGFPMGATWTPGTVTLLGPGLILTDVDQVSVPEEGTAGFQVKLGSQPTSTRTVHVSRESGDTDLSVKVGASLTFTTANWNTFQPVTLQAAKDADTIDGQATFRCSGTGLTATDVTATEQDAGPELVTVPDVVGLQRTDAEDAIAEVGLVLGNVTEQHNEAPAGQVLGQTPAADSEVLAGTTVDLTVSSGPEPVILTACIRDAWWTQQVDLDGDGKFSAMVLNWDSDVVGGRGSLKVFEKIYWKLSTASSWNLCYTSAVHPISGASTSDAQSMHMPPSDGATDYRIDVYREGLTTPDNGCEPQDDDDLRAHPEEAEMVEPPETAQGWSGAKLLREKMREETLPLALEAAPGQSVSMAGRFAVRLSADEPIDSDAVWAEAWADERLPMEVSWRPTDSENGLDGWAILTPTTPMPAGVTLTVTAGASTVNGQAVGPVEHRFLAAADKSEWNKSGSNVAPAEDVEGLPEPLAVAAAGAYRVGPAGVYDEPITVQAPVPAGADAENLQIYYYSESQLHRGWFLGEKVIGWIVPDSRTVVEENGQTFIEFKVNHSGVFQLGRPMAVKVAGLEVAPAGSPAEWTRFAVTVLALALVLSGLGIRRAGRDRVPTGKQEN